MIGPCRRVEFLPVALAVLSGALWAQRGTVPPGYTPVDPARTKHSSAQMTVSAPEAARTVAGACSGMSLGNGANLNGFVPFPSTNAWNINIAAAPIDPNSAAIVAAAGFAGNHLHPDFGAESYYGIPYVVVDSTTTPSVPVNVIDYAGESDVVVAPYPISAPIEGAPADCAGWPDTYWGDAHVVVLDRAKCELYETFNTNRCNGLWNASSETIWDMNNYESRPYGWTSADAAGLPIFPGLVRYDEVASGAIHHAIRFTLPHTKNDANDGYFVNPATHAAGTEWGVSNIMGMRIRLKSSFDISGFSAVNQVILRAMQQYGMILADNGSYFYFQGASDPRWDDSDLANLESVGSENFDVMQMTPEFPGEDSATAPTGALPTINSFTASQLSVSSGSPVTLNYSVSGDSYDYIDMLGPVAAGSGSVTINPVATQTYILNSTNAYGRTTSAPITILVPGSLMAPPVFTPAAGTYSSAQTVAIGTTTSPSATIYYTTNGSTPTTQSAVFSISNPITVSASETLKAIAVFSGYPTPSAVSSATYTIVSRPTGQAIAFGAVPNLPLGAAPFTISASAMIYPTPSTGPASSGLTVVFASTTSAVCTVSGTTVTLISAGACTIQATQAGNTNYAAATPVSQSFQVTSGAVPPALSITKTHTNNFTQGQNGATYSITVSNASGASPTSGMVTVTETAPAGMTVVSMNGGATWNCTALPTCTASGVLNGGTSYPPITVTVNVAPNAPAQVTNQVSVSGGGSATATASDPTIIAPLGCTYTISPTIASAGAGAGNGPVTVTAPAGCPWTATSNVSWLSLSGNTGGSGNGSVSYSVALNSGAMRVGTLTVAGQTVTITQAAAGPPSLPSITSLTPYSGTGLSQTFTAVFSDTNGWADISLAYFMVNVVESPSDACYVKYDASANALWLIANDAVSWLGPIAPGSGSLQNAACTLNGASSSVSGSGNNLTVNYAVTFVPNYVGQRGIYLSVANFEGNVLDWSPYGAWWPTLTSGTPVNWYRLYVPFNSSHHYTADYNEYTTLGSEGYVEEGAIGQLYNGPFGTAVPFYRIYIIPAATHFWTTDRNEYLTLILYRGYYAGEGIAGFLLATATNGALPYYRLLYCCATPPIHFWTTDSNENTVLQGEGWISEGIPGYMLPAGPLPSADDVPMVVAPPAGRAYQTRFLR